MSLISNKKAFFDYEILEKFSAGVELKGFEVKSLKKSQGSLKGAYVIVRGGEAFLLNAHIPPFQPKNTPKDYDPYRTRRLLLTKKEIVKLADIESQSGLTVVPLSMYNNNGKIKMEIAIARGKKKQDKRRTLRERQDKKEMAREMKRTLKNE